jgi:hypothetical protein
VAEQAEFDTHQSALMSGILFPSSNSAKDHYDYVDLKSE